MLEIFGYLSAFFAENLSEIFFTDKSFTHNDTSVESGVGIQKE